MKLKLYDQAWVELAGYGPHLLTLASDSPRVFRVLEFSYLEDGSASPRQITVKPVPRILLVYSSGCFRVA